MQPIEPVTPPDSRVWRVVHHPLTLIVIAALFAAVGIVIAQLIAFTIGERLGDWGHVLSATLAAATFLLLYQIFVRRIERRPVVDDLSGGGAAREMVGGLAAGAGMMAIIVAIIGSAGGYAVVGTRGPAVLVDMLAIAIVSGVSEEVVFRGWLFRLSERWLGSWAALGVSALVFGLVHLGNPNATLFAALCIAVEAGIMLAAVYMLTRRLWAAIGVHAAWNFVQGGIFGIEVSGVRTQGVLVPIVRGPDLLTGGTFGAEASLPGLLVGTAFGVALLVAAHRRGRVVAPSWRRRAGSVV